MNIFRKKPGKRRAESLIEVILAIFIIATGSATATSLIISATTANSLSRDNLIALNLAVEGIEGVRNIRDSNWLKFGYDKEHCWNMKPDKTACVGTDLIEEGNYKLFLDTTTMKWNLSAKTTDALNLSTGIATTNAQFQLFFYDLAGTADTDANGISTDDPDLYVAQGTSGAGSSSRFFRMITIDYPTGTPSTDQYINVSCLVEWKGTGSTPHRVQINTVLTNYNKVKVT